MIALRINESLERQLLKQSMLRETACVYQTVRHIQMEKIKCIDTKKTADFHSLLL